MSSEHKSIVVIQCRQQHRLLFWCEWLCQVKSLHQYPTVALDWLERDAKLGALGDKVLHGHALQLYHCKQDELSKQNISNISMITVQPLAVQVAVKSCCKCDTARICHETCHVIARGSVT